MTAAGGDVALAIVGVELAIRCRACDEPVPLRRVEPRVRCPSCARDVGVGDEVWSAALGHAAARFGGEALEHEAGKVFKFPDLTLRGAFRRTSAACGACREPLPMDDALAGPPTDHVHCPACGARATLRPPPIPIPGVELLIAEVHDVVAAEGAPIPCGGCGAPLPLDRGAAVARCAFCGTDCDVAAELERRRKLALQPTRFYVACRASAPVAATTTTWASASDVAVDERGNAYLVGRLAEGDADASLWAIDRDFKVIWVKRGLGYEPGSARLALGPGGVLGVWQPGRPVLTFVAASSGETTGVYPRHDGAPASVPIDRCASIAADVDGTFLVVVRSKTYGRAQEYGMFGRFSRDGRMLDPWEGVPAAPPELTDAIPNLRELGAHPRWVLGGPELSVAWTGVTLIYAPTFRGAVFGGGGLEVNAPIACVRLAKRGLPDLVDPIQGDASAVLRGDGRGHLFVLRRGELLDIPPRGGAVSRKIPAEPRRAHRLAVTPEGEVVIVGDGGRMRRISPSGVEVFATATCRADDDPG